MSTIRVGVVKQYNNYDNWKSIDVFLVGEGVPLRGLGKVVKGLKNKFGGKAVYGLKPQLRHRYNLTYRKVAANELLASDEILITFSPIDQDSPGITVTSKTFEMRSKGLLPGRYRLVIGLFYQDQIVRASYQNEQ